MPNKRKVALKEKSGLRGKAAIALLPKDAEHTTSLPWRMPLTLCDINPPFLASCWKIRYLSRTLANFLDFGTASTEGCETRPNKPKVEETCQFKKQSRSSRP